MRELFRAYGLPLLQNRTFESAASARKSGVGDVILEQDTHTGLVRNVAFEAARVHYDSSYQNEQAWSPAFQRHLDAVAAILLRHCSGMRVMEIGCGKGDFLRRLRGRGFDAVGMDPAYDHEDSFVVRESFRAGVVLSADVIVLRHVLEHVADPLDFLQGLRIANGGRGLIYIEVPCFDWICAHRTWFDICYEHVNYFRPRDLRQMFERVYESDHLFEGQYVYIVADLNSLTAPERVPGDEVALPNDFMHGVSRTVDVIRRSEGNRNVIWGAGSKGVTFAVHLARAGVTCDYVVDMNPAKQGRFLPGSALRVCAPSVFLESPQSGGNVFVVNWNYASEIRHCVGGSVNLVRVDHGAF